MKTNKSKQRKFKVYQEVDKNHSEYIGTVLGESEESVRKLVEKRRGGRLTIIEE